MITDTLRRWLNLVLSWAQIGVTILSFSFGTSFNDAAGSPSSDPPIVPAGYAFIIWSVIYAGSCAYGIYQFSAARSQDVTLRRIGFLTASSFAGCCCWLLCVRFGHLPWTIPCILWMALSLLAAFARLWRLNTLSLPFQLCVLAPISIYSGWISVAIFANTTAIANAFHWRPVLLAENGGSISMLLAAACLALTIFRMSGGNLWYGATIVWALIGIAVRNQFELKNAPVALTSWVLAGLFVLITTTARSLVAKPAANDSPSET